MPSQVDLAAQRIAATLSPEPTRRAAVWRWATVEAVNADGTMDVTIGGTSVPALTALSGATGASVGDRVRVDCLGADAVVTGVVASAPGASTPAGTVLWSNSGWAMAANVTLTLAHNMSTCPTGIVLHWQAYVNGETRDYDHVYTFISKQHAVVGAGAGVVCQLASSNFAYVGTKYVYVGNSTITGHANNTATGTANGITYNNGHWVLTQVISA